MGTHSFLASLAARKGRLFDGLLLGLLLGVAFLLGCYEMGDSDIWWHLRGGQWVLEQGRVPGLDPFTFGSADKPWIDIHWSYEVILALTYGAGGVGALVLLAAVLGAGAVLVCLTARRREWPVVVLVLCWLPALVLLAFRLDPRPEIFSLLYLGCFLAVLWRVEQRPAMAWLLPLVQVLWVNAQGLFIFGPILVVLFLAAHGALLLVRRLKGPWGWGPVERRWWLHVGGAAVAVAAACLVNPYFLAGARFPFVLFPKVAAAGNIYKQYIDELMSPRDYVQEHTLTVVGANWFFLAFYSLLLLLPLSFIFPALWRAWSAGRSSPRPTRAATTPTSAAEMWLGGLTGVLVLLVASALTLTGKGAPGWIVMVGDNVPLLLLLGGAAAAWVLRKRSGEAAILALAGGLALASWMVWLQTILLGGGRGLWSVKDPSLSSALPLVVTGVATSVLVMRWGGDLFRILLAASFTYLGLQALQNWSRFALVAGVVLAWNFGEWASQLAAREPGRSRVALAWSARGVLAAVLALWITALATDQYYVHTGVPRHFAFREEPLAFAHDAVLFAGQPGLPEHALVYGLGQTGLYVAHNSPRCKPFMDGRLEMPDRKTFEAYIHIEQWLRDRDPRWEPAVAELGNPLLLLEHENNYHAEALLLAHPEWRCIYWDALASVFVHRGAADAAMFPTVDFAARHVREPGAASTPDMRGAAAREEKALFNVAAALPRSSDMAWHGRIPLLLNALDRANRALAEDATRPDVWVLLGNCYWNLIPDLSTKPPTPAEQWSIERGIYWAQATYCHLQALERHPQDAAAWRYLFSSYRARDMLDCQAVAAEQWVLCDPKVTDEQREKLEKLRKAVGKIDVRGAPSTAEVPTNLTQLLLGNRPESASRLIEQSERRQRLQWTWPVAEEAAGLYMHLGRPAEARRIWLAAGDCPSVALLELRLGSTFWVERDFQAAIQHFRAAQAADPQRADVYWALAMLYAQLGEAGPALEACRHGLEQHPNERQRLDLEGLQQLLAQQ
jgi:tetratricopeptide (TPR) repeat protein